MGGLLKTHHSQSEKRQQPGGTALLASDWLIGWKLMIRVVTHLYQKRRWDEKVTSTLGVFCWDTCAFGAF